MQYQGQMNCSKENRSHFQCAVDIYTRRNQAAITPNSQIHATTLQGPHGNSLATCNKKITHAVYSFPNAIEKSRGDRKNHPMHREPTIGLQHKVPSACGSKVQGAPLLLVYPRPEAFARQALHLHFQPSPPRGSEPVE